MTATPVLARRALARVAIVVLIVMAVVAVARPSRADESAALFFVRERPVQVAHRHPADIRLGFPARHPRAAFIRITAGAPLELHPLVAVARRYVGSRNFTGVRAAWCAAALRNWLAGAGYSAPRSNRAIDFARYGRPTSPRVGAIMVARHHVGIVVGMSARGPVILSGNWGRRVGIGTFAGRRVLSYREPV